MNRTANRPAVLVTDAGYKHTLAAVRALRAAGYSVDAIGGRGSLCDSSRSLRKLITNVDVHEYSSPDALIKLLDESQYSAFLPIGARSIRFAAHHRDALAICTNLLVHNARTIELCMSKPRLNAHAAAIGISVPRFWLVDGDADVQRVADEAVFPIVIKKRHELDRGPVMLVRDSGDISSTLKLWRKSTTSAPMAQEFVDGVGCAMFALYNRGSLIRAFMHRRLREFPAAGGASCCAVSVFEPDLLAAGRRLLDGLCWHGIAMVEFKRDRHSGRLQLMELNPKFWGSLDLAIAAGVNFPVDAVRLACGDSLPQQDDYAVGMRFHWPLGRGELLHVVTRPASALSVLRDCLDPRVKTNLRWNDPLPVLSALREDFRALRSARGAR